MIGGQYLDTMEPGTDLETVHRLKTGCLFYASVTLALCAADLPREDQGAWRDFARRARDALPGRRRHPGRGRVRAEEGVEAARTRANRAAERALALLLEVPADTVGAGRDRQRPRRPNRVESDEEAPRRPAGRTRARGEHARRRRRSILAGLVPGHSKAGEQVDERAELARRARAEVRLARRREARRTRSTRSGSIRRGATASTSAPPRAASPTSCSSAALPA